ncbi:hypothetical protein IFM89_010285 [Coptis chinensis]|uniref:RRM domain-containing protein n=1 Tax=Coptis chinensis TaxID=261450 RepID=A0A835H582_9MAGN|nr:hypothetical protein IFM89_010285 [Coptis chinensis]
MATAPEVPPGYRDWSKCGDFGGPRKDVDAATREELRRQRRTKTYVPTPITVEQGMDIIKDGVTVRVCRYCCQKLDHDYAVCPSRDLSPLPLYPPPGAKILVPPLNIKENARNNSVIIKSLSKDIRDNDLLKLFTDFGPVSKVRVAMYKKTGVSLGVGFARFESIDDAERAMNNLNADGYHIEWLV